MDRALRNLLHLGAPLEQAGRRCATLPADYLGLAERGRLVPGAAADVVVVDNNPVASKRFCSKADRRDRGRLRTVAGISRSLPGRGRLSESMIAPDGIGALPAASSAIARATCRRRR